MPLTTGARLGPYEILAPIGAGGMGEVYKARDTRLDRIVAIKVLAANRVADEDHRRRFVQEAKAVSALNHVHIATLYELDVENGVDFLVLEYVAGKQLGKMIPARGLPVKEALRYAMQMADALAAAHTAGIVHRDIKPGNVIVTPELQVKILDFGLAKLTEHPRTDIETETLTYRETPHTEPGVLLGTIAYMSPEQASGRDVDHCTDIFSLGIVVYEMLAGRRPFDSTSQVDTLHAIIHNPVPPLTNQSAQMEEILAKALAKDPKERYQHAGDFGLDLRRLYAALESKQSPGLRGPPAAAARGRNWLLALGGVVVLAVGAIGLRLRHLDYFWSNPLTEAKITRLTDFEGDEIDAAISPDGKLVAFLSDRDGPIDAWVTQVGTGNFTNLTKGQFPNLLDEIAFGLGFSGDGTRIWVRGGRTVAGKPSISSLWSIPVMGGPPRQLFGAGPVNVAWSPDGRRIAYFIGGPKGDSIVLAEPDGTGARIVFTTSFGEHAHYPVWSPDGQSVYFVRGGVRLAQADVWRVPASGGKAEQITRHNSAVRYPAWLDSRTLVYIAPAADGSGTCLYGTDVERRVPHRLNTGVEQYRSIAGSNSGPGGRRRLVAAVANPSSHVWSIPITSDVATEKSAQQVNLPSVRAAGPRAGPGYLLYLTSTGGSDGIWRFKDGAGLELWTAGNGATIATPSISRDGQQVCFLERKGGRGTLFLMSAEGTNRKALAEGLDVQDDPSWSPDGQFLVVAARDRSGDKLFKVRVSDGTSVVLLDAPAHYPLWSPDGRVILYRQSDKANVEAITPEGTRYSTSLPDLPFRNAVNNPYRFLPDSTHIVALQGQYRQDNFWLVDLQTGQMRQITDLRPGFSITSFDVSPDGKSILFDRARLNSDVVMIEPNE
jgi:Tol biopolymer transport system component/tRNA A-37 threonylcarbamoyl transferase component Bud32